MNAPRNLYKDLERVIVTREEIAEAVKKLGRKITEDYAGKVPVLLCVLKGAVVFFGDLMREIDLPVEIEFMALSSYGNSTKTTGKVEIRKDIGCDVTGRDILIVEDIVDSGVTLSYLCRYLQGRGAASIRIATLLDKPARRRTDLKADYFCFTIPDAFVVGYGLDYAERYRNLPDIGILSPRIYES